LWLRTVLKIKDNKACARNSPPAVLEAAKVQREKLHETKEGGEEEVRRAVAASNATDWTKKHGPVLLDALAQC